MEDNINSSVDTSDNTSNPDMEEMLAELSSSVFPSKEDGSSTNESEDNEETTDSSAQKAITSTVSETKPAVSTDTTTNSTEQSETIKAPNSWKPEVAAKFAALPEDVRAEILRREQDIFKGVEQYKVAADYGQNVYKMLQPYQQRLTEAGVNPVDYLASLAQADSMIASASTQEQKLQYFRELAHHYGITVDHGLFGAEDSTVTALRQEINNLKSSFNSQLTQAQAKEIATIQKSIDEFRAQPEHKHFDVLQHEIAALLSSGVAKDLNDAYEKALWANPTTRMAEQTRLQEEKAKADAELQKKAIEEARRKRGINVKSTASGSTGGKATIDQTLNDTYDAVVSRASH